MLPQAYFKELFALYRLVYKSPILDFSQGRGDMLNTIKFLTFIIFMTPYTWIFFPELIFEIFTLILELIFFLSKIFYFFYKFKKQNFKMNSPKLIFKF